MLSRAGPGFGCSAGAVSAAYGREQSLQQDIRLQVLPHGHATGSPTAVEVSRTAARIESDNGRRYRNLVRYRRRSVDDLAGQATPMSM